MIDLQSGKFTVKGTKMKKYTVDFGRSNENQIPSCTCQYWNQWQIPCKHFFANFNLYPQWSWNQLSNQYLNSPYLSMDTDAIDRNFSSAQYRDLDILVEETPVVEGQISSNSVLVDIPTEKVLHAC